MSGSLRPGPGLRSAPRRTGREGTAFSGAAGASLAIVIVALIFFTLPQAAHGGVPDPALQGLQEAIATAAARVRPSVVGVRAMRWRCPPQGRGNVPGGDCGWVESVGTGFIVDARGYILTSGHVVDGGSDIRLRLMGGAPCPATLVALDRVGDLALLKAGCPGPFPAALPGDSRSLAVGDYLLCVGTPLGLSQSVTMGIVSGLHRTVATGQRDYVDLIQTDAVMAVGNSGGPLADINGRVVGLVTAVRAPRGAGFAIPMERALAFAKRGLSGVPLTTPTHKGTVHGVGLAVPSYQGTASGARLAPSVNQGAVSGAGLPTSIYQGTVSGTGSPSSVYQGAFPGTGLPLSSYQGAASTGFPTATSAPGQFSAGRQPIPAAQLKAPAAGSLPGANPPVATAAPQAAAPAVAGAGGVLAREVGGVSVAALLFKVIPVVFISAVVLSMIGIGGGFIYVPLLYSCGVDFNTAATTSLIMLTCAQLGALYTFFHSRIVDVRLAVILEVPTMVGALLGGILARNFDSGVLTAMFSGVLFFASFVMAQERVLLAGSPLGRGGLVVTGLMTRHRFRGQAVRVDLGLMLPLAFLVGYLGGMLGFSGGWLMIPAMVLMLDMPMKVAVATSALMVPFTGMAGFLGHSIAGHCDPLLALLLSAVALAGGLIGSRLSVGVESGFLRLVFSMILAMVGAGMLISAW